MLLLSCYDSRICMNDLRQIGQEPRLTITRTNQTPNTEPNVSKSLGVMLQNRMLTEKKSVCEIADYCLSTWATSAASAVLATGERFR